MEKKYVIKYKKSPFQNLKSTTKKTRTQKNIRESSSNFHFSLFFHLAFRIYYAPAFKSFIKASFRSFTNWLLSSSFHFFSPFPIFTDRFTHSHTFFSWFLLILNWIGTIKKDTWRKKIKFPLHHQLSVSHHLTLFLNVYLSHLTSYIQIRVLLSCNKKTTTKNRNEKSGKLNKIKQKKLLRLFVLLWTNFSLSLYYNMKTRKVITLKSKLFMLTVHAK